MKNRALLSAIALCFTAAGCDSQKAAEPPKPKTEASAPRPPEAPVAPAASAQQDAKPMQAAATDTKQAVAPTLGPPKGCGQTKKCKVQIDVGPNCAVTLDFKDLPVFKGAGMVEIKWSIRTSGWKFASNGIEFKTPNSPVSGLSGNNNNFSGTDDASKPGKFDYWVHVVNGKDKCDHDPSIVNGAEVESDPPY